MSDDDSNPRSRGCLSRIFTFILFLAAVGLGVAIFYAAKPQDLTDIKGYKNSTTPPRDLTLALRNAVERGYPLTLSEEDLNAWLKQTLILKQGGLLEKNVKLEGVAVRLEKERAEIIIERSVFGHPFTVSMYVRIEQTEGTDGVATTLHREGGAYFADFPRLKKGGRFGQLVVPQGLLLLVMPSFSELGTQFSKEIELGFEKMSRVSIEKNGLTLDPRFQGGSQSILPNTF